MRRGFFKTSKAMAADTIVKKAILDVLVNNSETNINHLLDVGFFDPVSSEEVRFIIYAIRALYKRGQMITPQSINRYLDGNTTRMTAFKAKRELQAIIN